MGVTDKPGLRKAHSVKTSQRRMPLEASKAGIMPIIDIKAMPIEPNTQVQWDTEERTAKKGVERTALRRESELPVEWTEVLVFLTKS